MIEKEERPVPTDSNHDHKLEILQSGKSYSTFLWCLTLCWGAFLGGFAMSIPPVAFRNLPHAILAVLCGLAEIGLLVIAFRSLTFRPSVFKMHHRPVIGGDLKGLVLAPWKADNRPVNLTLRKVEWLPFNGSDGQKILVEREIWRQEKTTSATRNGPSYEIPISFQIPHETGEHSPSHKILWY